MSYDYNALVTSLTTHRSNAAASAQKKDGTSARSYIEHLQESLQVFDTLSGHCPMTPLLWMQYAYDMYELMKSLSTSSDASALQTARQTRLETLEVGLNEFPGSAILQLHYCELLVESLSLSVPDEEDAETEQRKKTVQTALLRAIQQVGSGSHRNEATIIAQIYRVHAHFALTYQKNQDAALASLLQRARTPMEGANDSLMQEAQDFCLQQAKVSAPTLQEEFLPALEQARRWEAKAFLRLRSCEAEVTIAMHQEQIAFSNHVELEPPDDDTMFVTTSQQFEEQVLRGKPGQSSPRYWMGFGGAATAHAFLHYTTACRKFRFPKDDNHIDEDEDDRKKKQQHLSLCIYERGIAECPTVESMWLAYLKHVTWLWNHDPANAPSAQTFKGLSNRAVRNCPFSLALVQQQLHVSLLLANQENSEHVMDPDELVQIVTKALDSKFLPTPGQAFDLYVTAIRVVQRRILSILATSVEGYDPTKKDKHAAVLKFDDAEVLPSKIHKTNKKDKNNGTAATPLDDNAWQEIQDLCEEMRDMFEAAMARLNKDHASWTEGRALLQEEWGQMEQMVINPLLSISNPSNGAALDPSNGSGPTSSSVIFHFEKVFRLHRPPHPDSYRLLIEHVLHHGVGASSSNADNRRPGDIVARLRQVRGLYQKAIQSVGKAKPKYTTKALQTATGTSAIRDYETALSCLCHDYQQFERTFGSEQSLVNATHLMQKKLQKATFQSNPKHSPTKQQTEETPMDIDMDSSPEKRKASRNVDESQDGDGEGQNPPSKKQKTATKDADQANIATAKPKQQPKQHHKVKIGHIFHRAHPFTVRISKLALETEEMDLVALFREEHKCGAIVHARIQREKPFHAKGKEAKAGISKGWGLLQFEERESVEKSLELDQKIELHGKTLHVERSHVPAVGIVPPGMHRPSTNKHHTKKAEEEQNDKAPESGADKSRSAKATESTSKSGGSSVGVLAFRPRGVAQKKKQQGSKRANPKVKLNLNETANK